VHYVDRERERERESRIDNFPVKAEVQRINSHFLASRVEVHQKHTRNYVATRSSVLLEELTFPQKLKKFLQILWEPKVHFRAHNSLHFVLILS